VRRSFFLTPILTLCETLFFCRTGVLFLLQCRLIRFRSNFPAETGIGNRSILSLYIFLLHVSSVLWLHPIISSYLPPGFRLFHTLCFSLSTSMLCALANSSIVRLPPLSLPFHWFLTFISACFPEKKSLIARCTNHSFLSSSALLSLRT